MNNKENEKRLETLKHVREMVRRNEARGAYSYDGLTTQEIALYNRALMYGDNDEAFDEDFVRMVTS